MGGSSLAHKLKRSFHVRNAAADGGETSGSSPRTSPKAPLLEKVDAVANSAQETRQVALPEVLAAVEGASELTVAVVENLEGAAQTVSTVGEISEVVTEEIRAGEQIDTAEAYKTVAFWVSAAIAFGLGVGFVEGPSKASEFFAGYLLEQSLSVDNLFVFVLVFGYFKVPLSYQPRVLSYGIAGAVFFRAIMIGAGIAALQVFDGAFLIFAAVLLFSSYKLLVDADEDEDDDLSQNAIVKFCQNVIPVTSTYDGDKFFSIVNGARVATPLLLTLAVVELSDILFAFDSIPAVFGVTRDSFIVFSSNIFAILGLRSLFTVISTSMADLHYLQPAIAIVLGFIGSKMVADVFGFHVPTEASLGVVASLLSAGVFLSLRFPKAEDGDDGL